jgi:uncharacterized metal-binding protein
MYLPSGDIAGRPAVPLVVKDRVLGHNPVAALYTAASYYRRLQGT